MERTGQRIFGERFDMSQTEFAGQLDPNIVASTACRCGYQVSDELQHAFRLQYVDELEKELCEPDTSCELLPGVIELLEPLFEQAHLVHGLVTGNYSTAAHHKLRRVGLDPDRFVINGFAGEAPTRPALVALALQRFSVRYGVLPGDTLVIGDTPHDIDCAQAHGCMAVAVATGRFSADALTACGADLVLENLKQAQQLLDLLA